jgi:hypothetical protein
MQANPRVQARAVLVVAALLVIIPVFLLIRRF